MQRLKTTQVALAKAKILKSQGGCCAICKKAITVAEACQDHNHATGICRGALCRNCNGIEGKVKNLAIRGRRNLSPEAYIANIVRYWVYHAEDRTGLIYPTHLTEDEKRLKRNAKARKARAKKKEASK